MTESSGKPNESGSPAACFYDAKRKVWLTFRDPEEIIVAHKINDVLPALRKVENAAREDDLHAAGFVSYDAASAFERQMQAKPDLNFPLVWFGLFREPECSIDFPEPQRRSNIPDYDWVPSVSEAEYAKSIDRIKQHIERGETYQVNYTFRLRSGLQEPPASLFARMVASQGEGYSAFVDTGRWVICSASPELFFESDGIRLVSRPMKGTAARGLTRDDDLECAEWLRNSEKNRAENVMIVDMVRHDLGRIARKGTVRVDRLFDVEQYPTLWQMTSTVSCESDAGLTEVFQALFPAASITGAPKIRTMQIIDELEKTPRRLYTGTAGFVAPGGRCQFNVAIRTVTVDRETNSAEYGVGGGIVWDSTETGEYDECRTKARVLTHPVPDCALLESFLWTPRDGYFLLDLHLKRLAASAAYFGFPHDIAEIRRQLDAAAPRSSSEPHKVRLLVSKMGKTTIESAPLSAAAGNDGPVRLRLATSPIDPANIFLYHKTTQREVYEEAARQAGDCDDAVLWNPSGEITETCIANIVAEIDGELVTPPVRCGLLGGVFREKLLADGMLKERPIKQQELRKATKVYVINSVRSWREAILL